MAKTKKTSKKELSVVEKIISTIDESPKQVNYACGEHELTFVVTKHISLSKKASLMNSIVSMVFIEGKDEEVIYAPYLKEFAIAVNIIRYFTDIKLPGDIDAIRKFIYGTDIMKTICETVDGWQIDAVYREANELIEFEKNAMMKRSKLDGVIDSVKSLLESVNSKTESLNIEDIAKFVGENNPELKNKLLDFIKTSVPDSTEITGK